LLTITAVWWIARRVERANVNVSSDAELGGLSFWSTLAVGTTAGILIFSRAASFDIVITMTLAWTLAFFLAAELEESAQRQWRLLAGFYVFVGLSLLAKGLIGIIIPAGIVGAYYLLRLRAPQRRVILSLVWGLPLSVLVAAAWYAPMIWRHGWYFIDQFFVQHHFARYLTPKYHHPAPVYYYLLVFASLMLPWSAFAIHGILKALKGLRQRDDASRNDPANKFRVFAAVWVLLPLVFFSLSSSKLAGYILPVIPAAVLLVGERLTRVRVDHAGGRAAIRISAAFSVILAGVVFLVVGRSGMLAPVCVWLIMTVLVATGVFGLVWARRGTAFALITAGTTLGLVLILSFCGAVKLAERESSKQLLELAAARGYSQATVYGLQRSDRSPEFYAAGRVAYDADGEATKYEGVGQIVWESRRRQAVILTFVPDGEVNQFTQLTDAYVDVIGSNGVFTLVAVGPPR
jgi:4-amino-4-deoxy-L-arabinose transferase-like glycosyltransferase